MIDQTLKDLCPVGSLWKHIKRGHNYVVLGHCIIEKTMTTGVLYQEIDGLEPTLWMRPASEFLDGRFQPVSVEA